MLYEFEPAVFKGYTHISGNDRFFSGYLLLLSVPRNFQYAKQPHTESCVSFIWRPNEIAQAETLLFFTTNDSKNHIGIIKIRNRFCWGERGQMGLHLPP